MTLTSVQPGRRACVPCDSQGGSYVPCRRDDPDRYQPVCQRRAPFPNDHGTGERCDKFGCREAVKWRACEQCTPSTQDTTTSPTKEPA
jgi:hypothetical protein